MRSWPVTGVAHPELVRAHLEGVFRSQAASLSLAECFATVVTSSPRVLWLCSVLRSIHIVLSSSDSVPVRCGRTRDQLQTKSPRTNKSTANVPVTSICLADWFWISALPLTSEDKNQTAIAAGWRGIMHLNSSDPSMDTSALGPLLDYLPLPQNKNS
ncbi:hypothetical protein ATANTOWER_004750 [Ataeniobius toweri]|uniref:Uncharacterized protein n=1 Tax=Ataeniobius toweri TaxID=208326 RepID=A0ABU7BGQ7_9TELE|nr:hypothetical protein [Ataeniobius toweri]